MRARTSLGLGLQKLPPRTDAGREAVRALSARHHSIPVDYSELELRVLAQLGITVEDFRHGGGPP